MATASDTPTKPIEGEHRVVIRRVGWEGYQTLLKMVGEQPLRLTYDRGDVELMSPLPQHERLDSPTSAAFPEMPMDEIVRFATKEGIRDENAYLDEFSAWVREIVLPQIQGPGDE